MSGITLCALLWLGGLAYFLWFGPEDETEEEIDERSKMVNVCLIMAFLNVLISCFV